MSHLTQPTGDQPKPKKPYTRPESREFGPVSSVTQSTTFTGGSDGVFGFGGPFPTLS